MQSCNSTAKLHKFINLAKKYSATNRRKTVETSPKDPRYHHIPRQ